MVERDVAIRFIMASTAIARLSRMKKNIRLKRRHTAHIHVGCYATTLTLQRPQPAKFSQEKIFWELTKFTQINGIIKN